MSTLPTVNRDFFRKERFLCTDSFSTCNGSRFFDNSTNDTIIAGTAGNDTITNSGDSVTINAGAGNDRISVGSSNNVIVYNAGDGNDTIYGFDYGKATLQIASGDLKSITSNDGVDMLLHVDDNIITIKDAWLYVDVMPSSYKLNIVDASGKDLLSTITPVRFIEGSGYNRVSNLSVIGSEGDDSIENVSASNVTIDTGDGNDLINSTGSTMSIGTGADNDTININGGSNVTINAGLGDDRINFNSSSSDSNNVIVYNAGDGNDTINGFYYGTNSTLQIASGDLKSVTSNDGINLLLHVGENVITIKDGWRYLDGYSPYKLNIVDTAGNDLLSTITPVRFVEGSGYGSYNSVSNVSVIGSAGSDSIYNSNSNVTVDAGDGNDTITNSGASVTIDAGDGSDSISNSGGNSVSIYAGDGNDTITNSASNVTINGGAGNDRISLGSYNGSTSNINNVIVYNSGDGNDTIYGLEYGKATLQIASGDLKSVTSNDGMNLLLHVDDNVITIRDAWRYIDPSYSSTNLNIVDAAGNDLLSTITPVRFIKGSGYGSYNSVSNVSVIGSAGSDSIYNSNSNVTVDAGDGNDTITNSGASVTIDAGDGSDSISNSGGNSVSIYAGDGNDTISNSGTNVTINAGAGNDRISVGSSNNVIVYNAGDGNDTIYGFDYGKATLQIASGDLKSVTSNDGMNLLLHVDDNIITIRDAWRYIDPSYSSNKLNIVDAAGNNLLSTITPVRFIKGSGYGSYNSASNVSVVGSGDNDSIYNSYNGSNVTIDAGAGNDTITNSGSNVTIDAGDGGDSIYNSGGSTVSIYAGAGNDTITNSASNVTINGGAGNDRISLGSSGSSGSTSNINNVIVYNSGDGNDTIYAPNYGNATLQIASGDLTSVTSNDGINLLLHVGNNVITIYDAWRYIDPNYSSNKLNIVDAAGNNLISTITPVRLIKGSGYGSYNSASNVSVVGSAGNDSIYNSYNGTNVTVDAGDGNDTISNGGSTVSIYAGDGNDYIENFSGSNITINGGKGDDRISVSGSASNNVIVYNAGDGNDTIQGLSNYSTLQIASGGLTSVTSTDGRNLRLHVGDNIITIADAWRYFDSSSSGMLKIVDTSGNDLLSTITPVRFAKDHYGYSSAPNVSVVGSDGDDYIGNSYNGKNVTVHAGDGNDTIGNDGLNVTIDAGNGNDTISNGGSTVSVNAGDGDDTISNIGSNVTIVGGKGNDYINSNGNLIVYNSGDGNDTIYAPNYGNATLQIASGNLKSVTSNDGMNLLLHVDENIITIKDGWRYFDSSSSGMLKIVDTSGNDLLSTITPVRFAKDYYGYSSAPNVSVVGSDGDDYIGNSYNGKNVTVHAGDGDDSISNDGSNVTIDAGNGNDSISNGGSTVSVNAGDGDDTISNIGSNVTIVGGKGDDRISLGSGGSSNLIVYNSGDGNDIIESLSGGATLQIASGGLQSVTSNDGMDLLLHVDDNIITIKDGWRYFDSSSSGMLKIVDTSGNDLLSTITPVRFAKDYYGYSSAPNFSLVGSDGDDYIGNSYNGKNVTVHAGDGNDTIGNDGLNVTIDAGLGNDTISNGGSTVSVNAGDGDDTISNIGSNVTIVGGKGDDRISLGGSGSSNLIVYNSGDGNDIIESLSGGATLQIASGGLQSVTSNDGMDLLLHVGDDIITVKDGWRYFDGYSSDMLKIVDADGNNLLSTITPVFFVGRNTPYGYSSSPNVSLVGSDGDDYISNSGTNVTIDAGTGDDSISLGYSPSTLNNVIVYNEGDGNDTVTGFDATSTLQIVGTYYTQQSGSDIIVTVGDGSVLLKGAASLSAVNITGGDEIPAPSDWTITDGVASYKTLFTITGLKAGVTVDEIEANVSIGGATVTVNENVLGDDEVTISEGYTLALARTVELSEEFSATWNINGTTATYTGEYVTAGYAVVDGTIIHRDATDGKTFTLTGIKRNLTESALNENVTIDDTTVTLNENVLGNTTVTISDGFTLELADTVEQSEATDANWDINSAGDTSTAIYISGGTTAGYALDDNKIVYNGTTGGTFTLTGLSKTFSADDVSIDGNKIILSATALGQSNVTLTTTDGFTLALDEDCPTVTTVAKSWTLDGTTAIYHDAGKSDGYKLSTNAKTVTYTAATGGKTLLTVNGLADGLTVDEGAIDGLTVSGKTLTVTPEVVGENFSVDGGYKVVFSEGEYGWSTFTGTAGKDTIEVNGNGLQISLGAGNDTVTASVNGGNTYMFDANGGKDVVKGYNSDDVIKITDSSSVTTSVKGSDIIVKAGSATMTLKNAATGTHLNVVDSADKTLIDETVYADRIVVDDGATLLSAFNATNFTAEDPIVKVDASVVTKRFSLTGGDGDNTLIGGTGSNFINGGDGSNELTGGKGNDTFVAGNGVDTITDYGNGTDKISLTASISDFTVEGDDVIISFGDDKSMTIADGAGKKIYFLQNGKSSTEIFDAGGKMNTAKTSITLNASTDNYTAASTIITINGSLTEGVNIVGNAKANKIFGSDYDDTLNGGTKNATLTGGGGEDIFIYETGKIVISDYVSGDDRISLGASPTAESLKSNGDVFLKFGSDSLTIKKVGDTSNGRTITFTGEDGDDTTKTYFSEKIVGDDGITLTSSFAGNFVADGKVDASSNAKKITLTGGDDSDTLIGGKGTNVLNGNAGDDILIGNGGADTFVYSSGDDTITDYESKDKISLTSAIADFTIDGDDVIINFDDGSLTISDAANSAISFVETVNGRVTTNVNVFAENGIFNKLKTAVTLKADASSYTAPTNVISIDGGLATDAIEIVGNSKANKIYAGDNGSTLDGGSNNDSLWGGDGNDTFIYSGGKDVIYGFGDGDALNFNGDFTASVKSNSIAFKVGSTANAVTLKDYSATTFNVNGETYAISNGSNFVKK